MTVCMFLGSKICYAAHQRANKENVIEISDYIHLCFVQMVDGQELAVLGGKVFSWSGEVCVCRYKSAGGL